MIVAPFQTMASDSLETSSAVRPLSFLSGRLTKNIALGVGTLTLAILIGIVLGTVFPPPKPTAPWFWQVISGLKTDPSQGQIIDEAVLALTDDEVSNINIEIENLQREFAALNDRLNQLSEKVAIDPAIQGVNEQITAIEQKLSLLDQQNIQAAIPPSNATQVTLPLKLLFARNSYKLSPSGEELLPTLVQDLAASGGDTFRIAVHSADGTKQMPQQQLSFQRGKRVQQLLTDYLGDQYRWVVVGYPSGSIPLANDIIQTSEANERLEITIMATN